MSQEFPALSEKNLQFSRKPRYVWAAFGHLLLKPTMTRLQDTQGKVVVKMVLGETKYTSPSAGYLTIGAPQRNAPRGEPRADVPASARSCSRQGQAGHPGPGISATDATATERPRKSCDLPTTPRPGTQTRHTLTPLSLPW